MFAGTALDHMRPLGAALCLAPSLNNVRLVFGNPVGAILRRPFQLRLPTGLKSFFGFGEDDRVNMGGGRMATVGDWGLDGPDWPCRRRL